MRLKPVAPDGRLTLGDSDAKPPKHAPKGEELAAQIAKETLRIADLQRVLFADARHALLIVLQGRDASGKDGTIRHVFSAVNPQGCAVSAFGPPTEQESRHDFLWRVHQQIPPRGMIGIFNRSHYEDVLVRRVRKLSPKRLWKERYQQINDFEKMLTQEGVVILKFFLHISKDEQRERLCERLTDETKNWKFREGDLEDRAHWKEYTTAFKDMLRKCSTRRAPWYVVPGDDKDVRNWLIAKEIADMLSTLHLRYPKTDSPIRESDIV